MIETKEDLISDAVSCPTEVGPVGPEAVGFADEKYADSSREEEQARGTIFEFGGLFADNVSIFKDTLPSRPAGK